MGRCANLPILISFLQANFIYSTSGEDIAKIVSKSTGIPVQKMVATEANKLKDLENIPVLKEIVIKHRKRKPK